jgi:anti-sigma regulatory factor (Ser/Thr protein kinase)
MWWTRDFPGGKDQVPEARRWIEDLLPECGARDDVLLLATELCANAVVHTLSGRTGRFSVDVEWSPELARVVIGDQGSLTAPVVSAGEDDAGWDGECGRGLRLVDAMADGWGTARHLAGRSVWADVSWQARGGPLLQPPGGYEAVSADIAAMREAFPGTTIWWGHQTRAWRAALSGITDAKGLVSAPTRGELCQLLAAIYPDFRSTASRTGPHAAAVSR